MRFSYFFFLFSVYAFHKPVTLEELRKSTLYAYAASCRAGLNNWTCYWCDEMKNLPLVNVSVIFESNGFYGTYGYIGVVQNEVIVSFRASETDDNWIHDFEFQKTHYDGAPPSVLVHDGFFTSYQIVQNLVRKTVSTLRRYYPGIPVTFTGHSFGAALAMLCALDLVDQRIVPANKTQLINFGQPRVGNLPFVNYYNYFNISTTRVVNQRDIVPHLPMEIFGYSHSRTEYWFPTDTKTYVHCDNSGEDPKCSDSLYALNIYDHVTYLGFHSMDGSLHKCGGVPRKRSTLVKKPNKLIIHYNQLENKIGDYHVGSNYIHKVKK